MALYKWSTKLSGTGDWFHPEHEWNTGQILYKTAGGYDWDVVIQSDWNQTNQSAPDYIKNKPTVDSSLDTGSTNAIQNWAVATAVNSITWDISTIQWQITSIWTDKQDTLVSWTNIKTINSTSLLWSGDIAVQPTLISGTNIKTINNTSLLWSWNIAVQATLVSGTNIKKINNQSILGSWNLTVSWLPSGWTTWQVVTKTANWATWADNPWITVSWASFGSFINACKESWTQHTKTYSTSSSALNDTYVFKWKWWIWIKSFHWASSTASLSINWVTVLSENTGSGTYTTKYNIWPFTMSEWDYATFYTGSTWSSSSMVANVYDYYDWNTPVTKAWIYFSSSLWLISLSRDWTNWVTIKDRNLGATSNDVTSSSSYWNYYMYGNNYAFSSSWASSTSSSQKDWSAYWPWNYYRSSTYFTHSAWNIKMWDNSNNMNLWWDETNTNAARQWPCSEWYHIPSRSEWRDVFNTLEEFWLNTKEWLKKYLFMPLAWALSYDYWALIDTGTLWFWATTERVDNYNEFYWWWWRNWWEVGSRNIDWANAIPIRPFKNEPVQPTLDWDALYQPSS